MKKTATTYAEMHRCTNSNGKYEPKQITCESVGKTVDGRAIWREIGDVAEYIIVGGYFMDIDCYADLKGYYTSDIVDSYTED